MDPKTLDSIGVNQSNRNGWILCPSKTFPGKYYYFNVLSGEAAWCLSDNEVSKDFLEYRNTNLQKILRLDL